MEEGKKAGSALPTFTPRPFKAYRVNGPAPELPRQSLGHQGVSKCNLGTRGMAGSARPTFTKTKNLKLFYRAAASWGRRHLRL